MKQNRIWNSEYPREYPREYPSVSAMGSRLADRAPSAGHRRASLELMGQLNRREASAPTLPMAVNLSLNPGTSCEKIVSHRFGYVWVCIPKNASRSIIHALQTIDPTARYINDPDLSLDRLEQRFPEIADYTRIGFIRHPLDRILSLFLDKIDPAAREGVRPYDHRFILAPYHGLDHVSSFATFVQWLTGPFGADVFANRHWLSQHLLLESPHPAIRGFIGQVENIDEDWASITAKLGMPHIDLPRLNPSRRAEWTWDKTMNELPGIAGMLHERYRVDWDMWDNEKR